MGGEGSMMGAIISLRNNNRRTKREAFSYTESIEDSEGIPVKPISKENLEKIRVRIKSEYQAVRIKRRLVFCCLVLFIVGTIVYLKTVQ